MTGESVEQAALRRATETEWQGRARREAAALINQVGTVAFESASYEALLAVVAAAWLQGVSLGSHETLADAEAAFENVRAAL